MTDRPSRGRDREDFPGRQTTGRPDEPPGTSSTPPGRRTRTPEEGEVEIPEEGDEGEAPDEGGEAPADTP